MNDLDRVLAGVAEQPTVSESIRVLLANIATKLKMKQEPGSASEQEARANVGDLLVQHNDVITRHVLANTPVVTVPIERHPVPAEVKPAAVTREGRLIEADRPKPDTSKRQTLFGGPAAADAGIAASNSGARAWLDLAIFFRHAHRLDDMEQALRTMESSPLDHPESLMDGASLLLHADRDSPMAIRLLRRYLASPVEEGPAFKAYEMLGQLLEKQGDRRAAAEQYRAALALFHNYTRAQEDLKRVEH